MESGIRWESQGAYNNREVDGSGPEQLEQTLTLVNLNLPCSLLICSFISVVFTYAWVRYMTQVVMA